jgi:hypothetical protein
VELLLSFAWRVKTGPGYGDGLGGLKVIDIRNLRQQYSSGRFADSRD